MFGGAFVTPKFSNPSFWVNFKTEFACHEKAYKTHEHLIKTKHLFATFCFPRTPTLKSLNPPTLIDFGDPGLCIT